jgi:hypothetical protein
MTSSMVNARTRAVAELLKDVPLFAGLPGDDLLRLSLLLTEKHYPKESVIVSATAPKIEEEVAPVVAAAPAKKAAAKKAAPKK